MCIIAGCSISCEVAIHPIIATRDFCKIEKIDKISEKVHMAEAEADAMQELLGKPTRAKFEELETANQDLEIEAELAALKKKRQ